MKNVVVVAPHADDETLGVGGTVARHVDRGDKVTVVVMTGPGGGEHPIFPPETWEVVREEAREACEVLGAELVFRELPAVLIPDLPVWQVNREADSVLKELEPDVLYLPFPLDLHLDHRILFQAFTVASRPHTPRGQAVREIYAYETQSETHWNPSYLEAGFLPNVYVDITPYLGAKLKAMACYESQLQDFPHARSLEGLKALARFRGSQVSVEAAEAFVLIRQLL